MGSWKLCQDKRALFSKLLIYKGINCFITFSIINTSKFQKSVCLVDRQCIKMKRQIWDGKIVIFKFIMVTTTTSWGPRACIDFQMLQVWYSWVNLAMYILKLITNLKQIPNYDLNKEWTQTFQYCIAFCGTNLLVYWVSTSITTTFSPKPLSKKSKKNRLKFRHIFLETDISLGSLHV